MNDRRPGQSGPMRSGFLPHVPPPASLLLGFFFKCPVADGASCLCVYLCVRDEVYEKLRKKTS